MNKKIAVCVLALCLCIGLAVAAFTVQYQIPSNHVSIAGIGLNVSWLAEGETVGALVTQTEFGLITPPAKGIAFHPTNPAITNIVFVPDCNGVNEKVTWNSTLDGAVGTLALEIEYFFSVTDGWKWKTLEQGFTLTGHTVFGFRPSGDPVENDLGHIRIALQTVSTAPHGDFTFKITFNALQV